MAVGWGNLGGPPPWQRVALLRCRPARAACRVGARPRKLLQLTSIASDLLAPCSAASVWRTASPLSPRRAQIAVNSSCRRVVEAPCWARSSSSRWALAEHMGGVISSCAVLPTAASTVGTPRTPHARLHRLRLSPPLDTNPLPRHTPHAHVHACRTHSAWSLVCRALSTPHFHCRSASPSPARPSTAC